jgi:hypothetical protein
MKVRVFRIGIDWITYQFDGTYEGEYFDSIFRDYSQTASQRFGFPFFDHEFDMTYSEGRTKVILLFQYHGTNVFELVKNLNANAGRQYSYKFTFYGAYFYIEELSDILLAFTKRYSEHMTISRLDIALDCNIPVPVLYRRNRTQFHTEQLHNKYKILTGFYMGQRKGNKKYLIRVYDKKLDSQKKGKFHLFLPYLMEDVVSRIEAELHVLTLQIFGITPKTIIEYEEARITAFASVPDCMQQYFASLCMNDQGTYFFPLKSVDFANIERLTTAMNPKKAEEIIDKIGYVSQFLSRGRRLKEWGIDPIEILERHFTSPLRPPLTEEGLNQLFSSDLPF